MNYITKCAIIEEKLEWESYIPSNAKSLIIGTFPTIEERRSFPFFYPNINNPFWLVLSKISKLELIYSGTEAVLVNRKLILDKLKLGITDMGAQIYRHANSSLDQSILPIEFTDIFKILDENINISKLILTSSTGQNSVEGWFRSYCKLNGVIHKKMKGPNPKRSMLIHAGRNIDIVCVHSTSRAAGKKVDDLILMYSKEI